MLFPGSDYALQQVGTDVLVELVRSGERAAFCELLGRYSALARRTAFSIVKNKEDADDAVQDASIRAYLKIDSFEGNSTFSTWFTRIVINSCLMQLRRKRAHHLLSLDELMGEEGLISFSPPHPGATPEQQNVNAELAHLLRDAVGRLPTMLKGVVQDQIFEDLPIQELAAKRGLSVAAAKSRLFRARRKLTHSLEPFSSQRRPTACL